MDDRAAEATTIIHLFSSLIVFLYLVIVFILCSACNNIFNEKI